MCLPLIVGLYLHIREEVLDILLLNYVQLPDGIKKKTLHKIPCEKRIISFTKLYFFYASVCERRIKTFFFLISKSSLKYFSLIYQPRVRRNLFSPFVIDYSINTDKLFSHTFCFCTTSFSFTCLLINH